MKVRVDMEIDMSTGTYDVRFHNMTRPGDDIDVPRLATLVHRVIDNVAVKTHDEGRQDEPEWSKLEIN